jgi:transcriptional regulator with XRE-family HTH domain
MKNKFVYRFCDILNHSGLLQKELAGRLNVANQTVSSWATGRSEPGIDTLIRMCEIFGCTVGQLVGTEPIDVELPVLKDEFTE